MQADVRIEQSVQRLGAAGQLDEVALERLRERVEQGSTLTGRKSS